jgi:hypothetical protein
MQYIMGFVSAFFLLFFIVKLQNKYNILYNFSEKSFMPSQSKIHELAKEHMLVPIEENKIINKVSRQSELHEKRTNVKVIIMDDEAYWIKDNILYTASMAGNNVDKDTTRRVDTMTMSKVQLDKTMFIVDKLREEGLDDNWSSGH